MTDWSRDDRFPTRIVSEDESSYVDTNFLVSELEETLYAITERAINDKEPVALKVTSLFAFNSMRFEEVSKELADSKMLSSRFKSFKQGVKEALEVPDSELRNALKSLLEADSVAAEFISFLSERGGEMRSNHGKNQSAFFNYLRLRHPY